MLYYTVVYIAHTGHEQVLPYTSAGIRTVPYWYVLIVQTSVKVGSVTSVMMNDKLKFNADAKVRSRHFAYVVYSTEFEISLIFYNMLDWLSRPTNSSADYNFSSNTYLMSTKSARHRLSKKKATSHAARLS
jgi:hypothetical protein